MTSLVSVFWFGVESSGVAEHRCDVVGESNHGSSVHRRLAQLRLLHHGFDARQRTHVGEAGEMVRGLFWDFFFGGGLRSRVMIYLLLSATFNDHHESKSQLFLNKT